MSRRLTMKRRAAQSAVDNPQGKAKKKTTRRAKKKTTRRAKKKTTRKTRKK